MVLCWQGVTIWAWTSPLVTSLVITRNHGATLAGEVYDEWGKGNRSSQTK